MQAAIAAGHPATVEAGLEILADGGSAADAAVAACLASCVAETVMTGIWAAATRSSTTPRAARRATSTASSPCRASGAAPREVELLELDVPFGLELVHYAVGIASCGVPGVMAGLEALHRDHGRLPWQRLVEPALRLARDGIAFPEAHAACLAMLAAVMTMNEGERIYSPGGKLLRTGERLEQPGLVRAIELLADEGPRSVYEGSLAQALLELMDERGGLVTQADLDAYEARWTEPVEVGYAGTRVLTRAGLAPFGEVFARLPRLRGISPGERACVLARALEGPGPDGHTTNLVTTDHEGNGCVITTSLGLGSGDFLPGLDVHLNSMLGESDLIRGALVPGERMASMMVPTLALDDDGPCVRRRRRGRDALARSARPGRDRHPRRGPRSDGGRRPAQAAPGGRSGSARGRFPGRGAFRARGRRFRGPPLADAAPLLRRRQRGYADQRRGGSAAERRLGEPAPTLNGNQPR